MCVCVCVWVCVCVGGGGEGKSVREWKVGGREEKNETGERERGARGEERGESGHTWSFPSMLPHQLCCRKVSQGTACGERVNGITMVVETMATGNPPPHLPWKVDERVPPTMHPVADKEWLKRVGGERRGREGES